MYMKPMYIRVVYIVMCVLCIYIVSYVPKMHSHICLFPAPDEESPPPYGRL